MTLYLLFERLEAGKITLDTEMQVSEHASDQAPTKLGLKPGQTIAVEDAIKGDRDAIGQRAAVVIAESLGGDEDDFSKMMTRKARALGMTRTIYVNASGLPDDEQITTARDQSMLGRAIQDRFPRYYRYFSTEAFNYHGQAIRNHNHLLGIVEGVDGIKTGYTRASGFNLVTSVHRDGRYIVGVVLGGRAAFSATPHARIDQYAHQGSLAAAHGAGHRRKNGSARRAANPEQRALRTARAEAGRRRGEGVTVVARRRRRRRARPMAARPSPAIPSSRCW